MFVFSQTARVRAIRTWRVAVIDRVGSPWTEVVARWLCFVCHLPMACGCHSGRRRRIGSNRGSGDQWSDQTLLALIAVAILEQAIEYDRRLHSTLLAWCAGEMFIVFIVLQRLVLLG